MIRTTFLKPFTSIFSLPFGSYQCIVTVACKIGPVLYGVLTRGAPTQGERSQVNLPNFENFELDVRPRVPHGFG